MRDKEINRLGEYVGGNIMGVGAMTALALVLADAEDLWVATTLYGAFVAQALVTAIIKIVAYRKGLSSCGAPRAVHHRRHVAGREAHLGRRGHHGGRAPRLRRDRHGAPVPARAAHRDLMGRADGVDVRNLGAASSSRSPFSASAPPRPHARRMSRDAQFERVREHGVATASSSWAASLALVLLLSTSTGSGSPTPSSSRFMLSGILGSFAKLAAYREGMESL